MSRETEGGADVSRTCAAVPALRGKDRWTLAVGAWRSLPKRIKFSCSPPNSFSSSFYVGNVKQRVKADHPGVQDRASLTSETHLMLTLVKLHIYKIIITVLFLFRAAEPVRGEKGL